jgi:K+ transporter
MKEKIDMVRLFLEMDMAIPGHLTKYNVPDFSRMTEDEIVEHLRKKTTHIQFIDNPNERKQLAVVKSTGLALRWIKHPTILVQSEAVRNNGKAIQYINNPTEEMKIYSVKSKGEAIQFIENPTDKMIEMQLKVVLWL